MTKILASKITVYLIKKNMIAENKKEWCIYALEKRISSFVTMSFIIVVCGILFGLIETLIATFTMVSIRKRTGGYHAKTPIMCLVMSLSLVFLGIYIAQSLQDKYFLQAAMIAVSLVIIYCLAPVNHPNLKLNEKEIAMNRKLAFIRTTIATVASIFLNIVFASTSWGACATVGIAWAALSVAAAKILKQEVAIDKG